MRYRDLLQEEGMVTSPTCRSGPNACCGTTRSGNGTGESRPRASGGTPSGPAPGVRTPDWNHRRKARRTTTGVTGRAVSYSLVYSVCGCSGDDCLYGYPLTGESCHWGRLTSAGVRHGHGRCRLLPSAQQPVRVYQLTAARSTPIWRWPFACSGTGSPRKTGSSSVPT